MKRTKYTKDLLTPIVSRCKSMTSVLRELNLSITGGNHRHISGIVKYLELDTSHFTGQLWSKGLTKLNNASLANSAEKAKIPDSEFFKDNSYPVSGGKISKRLQDKGWKYVCNNCGLHEWLGKPITLHVDHINGKHTDNRLENLQFLCPNCHQQTDTWGNKSSSRC